MQKLSAITSTIICLLSSGAAQAHPGHLIDAGRGHDHWLALVAFVLAFAIAAILWRRRNAVDRSSGPRVD